MMAAIGAIITSAFGALTGASWITTASGAVLTGLKYVWQGVMDCLTHPASLTIIAIAVWGGYAWKAHNGNAELTAIKRDIAAANARAADKVVEARRAGDRAAKAEAERDAMLAGLAKAMPVPDSPPVAPAPRRVRKSAPRPVSSGFSLLGLFSGGKAP